MIHGGGNLSSTERPRRVRNAGRKQAGFLDTNQATSVVFWGRRWRARFYLAFWKETTVRPDGGSVGVRARDRSPVRICTTRFSGLHLFVNGEIRGDGPGGG